jgi:hypothetical protein
MDANTLNNLGLDLERAGQIDEAFSHYQSALALNPDHPEALNNTGNILKSWGRFDDALNIYNRALITRPSYPEAHFNRAEIVSAWSSQLIQFLKLITADGSVPTDKRPYIHFALAKALNDEGDYPGALEQWTLGNALKRSKVIYNELTTLQSFSVIPTAFNHRLMSSLSGSCPPTLTPLLFIVGMPRSGTTLIEQILASHPHVHAAGELPELKKAVDPELGANLSPTLLRRISDKYAASIPPADGKLRFVDKMPSNFFYLGLIALLFPNARIIHAVRNPIATCFSCYTKLFAAGQYFTYDLGEVGRYYRGYAGLMEYWRNVLPAGMMLDVTYEDVVGDLDSEARRLVDFCGLKWNDRCLRFWETERTVKTASAVQVRRPIFRESLDHWKRYEFGLGPLIRELE